MYVWHVCVEGYKHMEIRGQFLPLHRVGYGTKLRSSGLVAGTVTCSAVSVVLFNGFLRIRRTGRKKNHQLPHQFVIREPSKNAELVSVGREHYFIHLVGELRGPYFKRLPQ